MSLREHYENLDQYTMYDYKDVANAYGHGEWDAIDKVLEIITIRKSSVAYDKDKAYKLACDDIEHAVLALKEGEQK